MRITQGTFSFLADLTDDQIEAQVRYCLDRGWAVSVEYTDDPHPRNTYWEMWELPLFDQADPGEVMAVVRACMEAKPHHYVKVNAFDATKGWESLRLSFLVARPEDEPGFVLDRSVGPGRNLGYTTRPYASAAPVGRRYR
jgi:ribulose-bisphosphate carboxylase small chain